MPSEESAQHLVRHLGIPAEAHTRYAPRNYPYHQWVCKPPGLDDLGDHAQECLDEFDERRDPADCVGVAEQIQEVVVENAPEPL